MSKTQNPPQSEALKKFQEGVEKGKEQTRTAEEFKKKKLFVDDYKITNELERIKKNEEDLKRAEKVNVGIMTEEDILDTQNKNRIYLEGAKNGMDFLHKSFRKWVPCWAGSLILIGSRTGGGKSSVTANLILSTMQQKNPITGENRKVLTISCEETPLQVYNRLTCLVKNYNFNEQDEFTDQQKQDLIDFIPKWAGAGVSVIGEDGHGRTDSLEGIKSIFDNLIATKTYYDLILIDYIQKITTSKKNPQMQQFTVLKEVMNLLDNMKNVYPAAIVVMSQLKANDAEDTLDFQERLRGSKDIITPCTVALELVPDVNLLRSRFIVRKNRYKGSTLGGHRDMGYDRGKFVPYTDDFIVKAALSREAKERHESYGKHVDDQKNDTKQENKE